MAEPHHPHSPQNRWSTRKPLRLRDYDYSQPGYYFVTICTRDRKPWFGTITNGVMNLNASGEIVQSVWLSLPKRFPGIELDQFAIMPNHVHGLLALTEEARYQQEKNTRKPTLSSIMSVFKETATSRIRRAVAADFAWQPSFHDRIIRHERMLDHVRQYVATNPARWMKDEFYASGE